MSTRLVFVDETSGSLKENSTLNPLPVTAAFTGTSAVGLTGTTAPTSADEIGWIDGSGNLTAVSAATPLPVAATVSAEEIVLNVTGSVSSAAVLSNFPITTTGYRTASVQVTNAGSGCTLIAEQSNDGTTWYGIQVPTDTVAESATPLTAVGLYNFPVSAKQFRIRCSVYGSGTPAVNAQFRLAEIDYAQESVALITNAQLTTINTTLGAPFQAGGSIGNTAFIANAGTNLNTSLLALESGGNLATLAGTVGSSKVNVNISSGSIANTSFIATQATAASLNATVVGTGTFAVQAAQSGTYTVGISAAQTIAVTNAGTFAVTQATAANLNAQVAGPAASGASVSGNPLLCGARASTTIPTAVADGQAVALRASKHGNLIVSDGASRELRGTQNTIITASTSETTIVTAVASTFLDLYGLILANTGATTTKVNIRDTTGGSIITTFEVPTLETRGFMLPASSGIAQTTVNTNWTAQCGSSTSSLEVTALYVKNT